MKTESLKEVDLLDHESGMDDAYDRQILANRRCPIAMGQTASPDAELITIAIHEGEADYFRKKQIQPPHNWVTSAAGWFIRVTKPGESAVWNGEVDSTVLRLPVEQVMRWIGFTSLKTSGSDIIADPWDVARVLLDCVLMRVDGGRPILDLHERQNAPTQIEGDASITEPVQPWMPLKRGEAELLEGGLLAISIYKADPFEVNDGESGWIVRTVPAIASQDWCGEMDATVRHVPDTEMVETLLMAEQLHIIGAARRPDPV